MAKEKQEYEFQMPAFDETEFIEEQKKKAKASFISFAFGILMGIICGVIWMYIDDSAFRWPVTFFLGICSIGFLIKIFQIFKINISSFEKKDWLGTGAFYFFTFLAIFIIAINPPFYDGSSPKIEIAALPDIQEPGGNITIVAKLTDNVGIKEEGIRITRGEDIVNSSSLIKENEQIYFYTFTPKDNIVSTFNFTIWAKDKNDLEATKNGSFSYINNIVYIDQYSNNQHLSIDDEIKIRVKKPIEEKDNIRVYYTVNKGNEINATFTGVNTDAGELIYTTSTKYAGWVTGPATVNVFVETVYHFILPKDTTQSDKTSHSSIIDNQNYSFVADAPIGNETSPQIKMPGPRTLERVPGFELPIMIAAIALLIAIKGRKKLYA